MTRKKLRNRQIVSRENALLLELAETARMWGRHFTGRSFSSCMTKVNEEIVEYNEAVQREQQDLILDEFADVFVNMFRAFMSLPPNEQRFVIMTVQDKTYRRIWTPGVKDKKTEGVERREIARNLGVIE